MKGGKKMYEIMKKGSKTIDVLMNDLDERRISMLFGTLAMSSVLNQSEFLKIIEKSNLDKEAIEKFFYESLYFHIRKVISSNSILDEIKGPTKESSSLIKKKLRGELDGFCLRNKWLIDDSIKEYKENIEVGRSENFDFSITLILRRTEEGEEKRVLFKRMLKESFFENEKNTLKEIKKGITNKNIDDLMLYLGMATLEEGSIVERNDLKTKCNDIGEKQSRFLRNELKEGVISVALHSIFVQGLIISIGYKELIEMKKFEIDELENVIFEIAFFHTRLLIRNKDVINKLSGYAEEREVKNELLTELDNLAVRSGRSMKESMVEFRNA